MKRIILCIILLSQLPVFSQNGSVFNYRFKPNRTYIQTVELREISETKYSGDSLFRLKVKENKLKEFESTENLQHIETVIKTDGLVNDTNYKITFEFTKPLYNNTPIVPLGTKLFAHCSTRKFMPTIDSVSNLEITKDKSKPLIDLARSIILNIEFPEKRMTKGEVFFKTYPITFPGKDNELIIVLVGTGYKLLKIEKGIATFEIKQIYKINPGITKIKPSISGEGNGILLYDINENFYTKYDLNTKFVFSVKKENYTIQTTTTSNLSHTVKIVTK